MTTAANDGGAIPTADEAFGHAVNSAMFRQRVKGYKLAATLQCSPTTLSKKLHGERPWKLDEMIKVADALRVDLRDLLAEMWQDPGSPNIDGKLPRLDSNQQPFDYRAHALPDDLQATVTDIRDAPSRRAA